MCPHLALSASEGWRLQVRCSKACCNASPLTMYGPVQCRHQSGQEAQCSGAVMVGTLYLHHTAGSPCCCNIFTIREVSTRYTSALQSELA